MVIKQKYTNYQRLSWLLDKKVSIGESAATVKIGELICVSKKHAEWLDPVFGNWRLKRPGARGSETGFLAILEGNNIVITSEGGQSNGLWEQIKFLEKHLLATTGNQVEEVLLKLPMWTRKVIGVVNDAPLRYYFAYEDDDFRKVRLMESAYPELDINEIVTPLSNLRLRELLQTYVGVHQFQLWETLHIRIPEGVCCP